MSEETNTAAIEKAIQDARAEGEFRGAVLAKINSIADTLKDMSGKHNTQDELIASKVGIKQFGELVQKVDDLQKKVYMGVGILTAVQILIAALK